MLKKLFATALILAAVGYTPAPALADDPAIEVVKLSVSSVLRDPESARFRELNVLMRSDNTMCSFGLVQGRNGYGGLGNPMRFYVDFRTKAVIVGDENALSREGKIEALNALNGTLDCLRQASSSVYGIECDKNAPAGKCVNPMAF